MKAKRVGTLDLDALKSVVEEGGVVVSEPETGIFEGLDEVEARSDLVESDSGLFEGAPEPPIEHSSRPNDGIPPLDSDLDAEEREEFVKLLNKAMPIAARANQLAKLATFSDAKRAAVGLRAIQEINEITGVKKERVGDAPPMFMLPPDAKVSVAVVKVTK